MRLIVALLAATTCRVDAFNVPTAPATPMGTVTRSAPAAMFFGAGAAKPAKTAKKGKPAAKKTMRCCVSVGPCATSRPATLLRAPVALQPQAGQGAARRWRQAGRVRAGSLSLAIRAPDSPSRGA